MKRVVLSVAALVLLTGCVATVVRGPDWSMWRVQVFEKQAIPVIQVESNRVYMAGYATGIDTNAAAIVEAIVEGVTKGLVEKGVMMQEGGR